ncbi:hypothetical protein FEM48_ZijujUnG0053000 [Ziziphus jujuba var. spinosa]|uniref:glucan endo-1,3-beta-D-glucosidase n=1 Tax=Ziziphus jujuba var. spinosa TaxID=714518 RepID=A0A978U968_ZIZJJ|nr:hypothetical protein FEM48_ZijujUnG0053000 [Ziziphus jujuba var. spinosa]
MTKYDDEDISAPSQPAIACPTIRVANNLPPPSDVVNILKFNNISSLLLPLLDSPSASLDWLQSNIFVHVPADQVRYIAVGNEVFLKDPFYTPHVVPAVLNLHQALQNLGFSDSIKLSSPQAASVLANSYPPSSASFDPRLQSFMIPYLQFLRETRSPFMVNVYPYLSYISNMQDISLDYALFGGADDHYSLTYSNLFDASLDSFVYAMEKEGFDGIPVVVTETGWPTSGGEAASSANALVYNGNVVRRSVRDVGTPLRQGVGVEVYLFDLFDENEKVGEEYERHFGIFGLDGVKAYDLNLN